MKLVHDTLLDLAVGGPTSHERLSMYPLSGPPPAGRSYLLLDEALAADLAIVREISQSGLVPELLFENRSDRAVLLLDGEELVGAKQNRILNLTVLAPARTTITIPVSCVEAGRWRYETDHVRSANRAFYSSARARKSRDVSSSLARGGRPESDQGAVWDDIASKMARMEVRPQTSAVADRYAARKPRLDEFAAAFAAAPDQVGAIFAIEGIVCGLDLFDHPGTMARLLGKLVRSYALDAIDDGLAAPSPAGEMQDVTAFLRDVAGARFNAFPAIGEGDDLRLDSPQLCGGALRADGRIVHLCAFGSTDEAGEDGPAHRSGGLASMRQRRRGRAAH